MLTRKQQIQKALAILNPPADKRAWCRGNIEYMLDDVEHSRLGVRPHCGAKTEVRAWQRYHRAACNLRDAHNALAVAGWGTPLDLAEIERAIAESSPEVIQKRRDFIAVCMNWMVTGSEFERLGGAVRQRAVESAYELLEQWRSGERIVTTQNGKWARLSAILSDEPRPAGLFRYLLAFRKYIEGKTIP